MANSGRIKVNKRSSGYSLIDNTITQNKSLSWKAKGLLCYLLSLPPDWELYKTELQNHAKDGRDGTISGFNELVRAGYITEFKVRDSQGHFKGCTYVVHERPNTENTESDKPNTENPISDNTELQNTNSTKETLTKETSLLSAKTINLFGDTVEPSKNLPKHLFEDSEFFDFEKFKEKFMGPEFENVDLFYYHRAVSDWSKSKSEKKVDWIATARGFIRRDSKSRQGVRMIQKPESRDEMKDFLSRNQL